jgi:predicted dehydrogenase
MSNEASARCTLSYSTVFKTPDFYIVGSSVKKLRVGIAGYGVVGKRRRYFVDMNSHMETVAISDVTFDARRTGADGVVQYPSYKELLTHGLEVVFVCLPNYLAADATMRALKNGIHVFCEKPPGRNLKDIKDVRAVERCHPLLRLKYGFNHRYHDSFIEASKIVQSGKFGKLLNIRGIYGKSRIIPFDGGWRSERKLAGGGILLDQGIHMLDMICSLAGDFDEVSSFVSNDYWKHNVEDNAFAMMRSKNGCVAIIHSTATQWQHRFRLELTLENAFLELSGILSGSKSYGEERITMIPRDSDSNNGSFKEVTRSFLDDRSWKREIDEFAELILRGEPVVNGSSSDAYRVMELVQRIYYADQKWRRKFRIARP